MTEWWACLCEAKLSGRAMRYAGFVRAEHNSISGGVWHKQETIQKYLRGHTDREVRYAREELRINGFLVQEYDPGERRLVWFPAIPNQKAEKKSGTNRSSQTGTNGSSPEEPTVPPKPEPTVPPKAEPLVPHILEGITEGITEPTGSISEQSKSAHASGVRAGQPEPSHGNQNARKVEDEAKHLDHANPDPFDLDDDLDDLDEHRKPLAEVSFEDTVTVADPDHGNYSHRRVRPIGRALVEF